jgi:hypothetical protein
MRIIGGARRHGGFVAADVGRGLEAERAAVRCAAVGETWCNHQVRINNIMCGGCRAIITACLDLEATPTISAATAEITPSRRTRWPRLADRGRVLCRRHPVLTRYAWERNRLLGK